MVIVFFRYSKPSYSTLQGYIAWFWSSIQNIISGINCSLCFDNSVNVGGGLTQLSGEVSKLDCEGNLLNTSMGLLPYHCLPKLVEIYSHKWFSWFSLPYCFFHVDYRRQQSMTIPDIGQGYLLFHNCLTEPWEVWTDKCCFDQCFMISFQCAVFVRKEKAWW